jgi:hypothetical protein
VLMAQLLLPSESGWKRTVTDHASPAPREYAPAPETTVNVGQELWIRPDKVPPPPLRRVKGSSDA